MKNNLSMTRDEQIASILYAVNTLKVRGYIKTQKEFASLLGITEQTLTNAIRGNGRSLNTTLVQRVAHMMQEKYGIDILGPQARIFITGDAISAPEAPADSSIKTTDENIGRLLDILADRDKQINRLLTLLENEQNGRK